MKATRTLAAAATVAAFTLGAAGAAQACNTKLSVHNNSAAPVSLASVSTQKQGARRWVGNILSAINLAKAISPGQSVRWTIVTNRKKKTNFRIKLTYSKGGARGVVESGFARCGNGHSVTIN